MSEFPQAREPEDAAESAESRALIPPEARQEVEAVLSAFRQWLLDAEQWRNAVRAPDDEAEADAAVDLHTLLEEWAALKQEVRLEARVSRTAREKLDQAADAFRQGLDQAEHGMRGVVDPLVRDRDRLRDQLSSELDAQQRGWLDLLLDIRESLAHGADASLQARRRLGWRRWFLRRPLFDSLVAGYELSLRRLDASLESRGVRPIECVGQRVDPERMRVVELVHGTDSPPGQVVDVLRRGYTCGDKVIRYAEVRAAAAGTPDQQPAASDRSMLEED